MTTAVTICSNALLMNGAKTINDFTENNDRARLVSNLWPQIRDWLIRSHNWNSCVARVQLAPDVVTPSFDWNFQYSIPNDWLRTLQVGELGIPVDYAHEGRKILCDENPLNLVYVFRQDEGSWDTGLQFVATLAMCAVTAYPLTQSASFAASQYALFVQELRKVKSTDGQDIPPETLGDFRYFNSRFTSTVPTPF
jgi:hypothetical protein